MGNLRVVSFWDPVVERILHWLYGWKEANMSIGCRITLMQSWVSFILLYFLYLFKASIKVAFRIKKLKDFIWSGFGEGKRDHLMGWN